MWRALVIASLVAPPLAAQDFFTLKGHGGPIMDITVAPTGEIATASFDNSVGVWGKPFGTALWIEGHTAAVNTVAYLDDPQLLASGGDDFSLRLWSGKTRQSIEVGTHTAKIVDLAFHAPSRTLVSASWDSRIGIWTLADATGALDPSQPPRVDAAFLTGHEKGVNDVALSKDGRTLYSASVDGTIRIWDMASVSEKQVFIKHGFGVNKLILNEKDGWLAYGAVDGGTRIVDLETGQEIADFTLGRRPILALAYHPATQQLAVGDGEGYIMVLDAAQRRIIRDFRASRRGPVWALAFSPDGQNIHAGGIEDIVYSWPIATMNQHGAMSDGTRSFLEDPETLPNGERQFKRKCSICHTLTLGSARKAGPSLYNLFGRRAGTVADYSYSETLKGSEIVWSTETIDALFDIGPDHYVPGTKMPMQRIVQKTDRDDLIEYLRTATVQRKN